MKAVHAPCKKVNSEVTYKVSVVAYHWQCHSLSVSSVNKDVVSHIPPVCIQTHVLYVCHKQDLILYFSFKSYKICECFSLLPYINPFKYLCLIPLYRCSITD